MRIAASPAGLNRMERDIAPPMKLAFTIPIEINGRPGPVCAYVCWAMFAPGGPPDPHDLKQVARLVHDAVNGRQALVKWILKGEEVDEGTEGAVEIRSAGPGWRWHDFEFNEWGTGAGPHGPVWRKEWKERPCSRCGVRHHVSIPCASESGR